MIREIDPANRRDVAAITGLHLRLLGHGPMARLGELFVKTSVAQENVTLTLLLD